MRLYNGRTGAGGALCARRRTKASNIAFMSASDWVSTGWIPSRSSDSFSVIPYVHAAESSTSRVSPTGVIENELRSPIQGIQMIVSETTTSLIRGGVVGAFVGLVRGGWVHRSFGGAFAEARMDALSWGGLTGIYVALQTTAQVVRNKEDRYNAMIAACGSGALYSMKSGPQAMVQGCVKFAAFTYFIDAFLTPKEFKLPREDSLSPEVILRK